MNLKDIITVEFSLDQKCFHIDTMDRVLEKNLVSAMARKQTSYQLVGVFASFEQADAWVEQLRKRFKLDDYTLFTDLKGNVIVNNS